MSRIIGICLMVLISPFISEAQKFTISGYVKDQRNGEDLIGATVMVEGLSGVGSVSNIYGFYSITLDPGEYSLVYEFVGFRSEVRKVELDSNLTINVNLSEDSQVLNAVVVTADQEDENVTSTEIGVTRIEISDVKDVAVFAGEPDVLKIAELNPGIKPAGEGNAGFYVRGGGLDQNLILLDEAIVYNPSHILGLFSVFNGDALKNAVTYKGGMLPEYGGRTSSVMDLRMKDGNNKKFEVAGGIGLITSKLTVEGPIVPDKGSFILSGRRTYIDLLLGLARDSDLSNSSLNFYDFNAKANYTLGKKDRLFISGYFGRDNFGFNDNFGLGWGNATGTIRWNHLFSDKLFSNTSVIVSDYDYQFEIGEGTTGFAVESVIRDLSLKQDFTYFMNDRSTVKFGVNLIRHQLEPGNLTTGDDTGFTAENAERRTGLETAVYLQNEHKITNRLSMNYGLRYSNFNYLGPGTVNEFDENGKLTNQVYFQDSRVIQTYGGFEPRLSANYLLNQTSSLKFGANRNYQYLHLLTNSTTSSPTDVWIMSSNNVKPQIANQISMGYFKNFQSNTYEGSVELYYKNMDNAIDYRNGANVLFNETVEGDLVYGKGRAYGAEFLLRKRKGRITGWVGYTLSRTLRQFDEINNGEEFPARQDRIHDLSLVTLFDLHERLKLSLNYVFYTGDAVTFPSGRYEIGGMVVPYYTDRNSYRMPDYHRVDLGLTFIRKSTEKFESSWGFTFYNILARENAYTITFQQSEEDPGVTQAVQLSLFRMVPSFTYNFRFK